MFGSQILDVAIGLAFVFSLVSLICSALREVAEAWFKSRAVYLERGIRELLKASDTDDSLVRALYEHPAINGLYGGPYETAAKRAGVGALVYRTKLPAYIPTRNFAVALLDLAARGNVGNANATEAARPISLETLREPASFIQSPHVRRAITAAVDLAGPGDVAQVQANIQAWFDSTMDRVSGWYKRRTQAYLLVSGLVVAVALNVDTVRIARHLYHNESARRALVASATGTAPSGEPLAQLLARLDALPLPIGWPDGFPNVLSLGASMSLETVIGWMITALAVSLGAPFWFDLLNKIMVIRSTVKPHEKSPEESSEDRQRGEERRRNAGQANAGAVREATPTGAAGGGATHHADLAKELPEQPAFPV